MKHTGLVLMNWIKKYEIWFKLLFIFAVSIFVFYEAKSIAADVNLKLLKKSLTSQSWWSISLMFFTGILSLLPMMGSDFVITKLLPGPFSKGYIWKAGWITNTFANIGGVGGLVSAPLRAYFYGKSASKKEVAIAVSKIEMFLISGFCIQSFLALLLLVIPSYITTFEHYWPIVLVGALIFPTVYLTTKWKTKTFFDTFSLKQQGILLASSSFGWWLSFAAFTLIGYLLNEPIDLIKLFVVFVIGSAIGMFSLIPGGLGTFDLFILFAFSTFGITKEIGIVWLLFYRVFAYIVPFLLGFILFIPDLIRILIRSFQKTKKSTSL